jgi:DNA modification methylase
MEGYSIIPQKYNLKKKYESLDDGIDIQEYFNWCDKWLSELARVLKPGRVRTQTFFQIKMQNLQ